MRVAKLKIFERKNAPQKSNSRFMLSGTPPGSKRIREYFPSRTAAERRKMELETDISRAGIRSLSLSADERREIADYKARLESFDKSIGEAVEFFLEHLERQRTESTVTVQRAFDLMQDIKENDGLSDRYRSDLRSKCGRFAAKFGKRSCSSITADEARRWLTSLKLKATSQNDYRRTVSVLFSFAQKEGFCRENPFAKVDAKKAVQDAPGIIRAEAMSTILRHVQEHHADIMAAFCIQAFAGLRTAEVERLQWGSIRLEDRVIEVNAAASKNNVRRPVHIEENLAEWLLAHRKPSGPVAPACYLRCLAAVRKAMLAQMPPIEMPHNCLRHSFGTYYCARSGSTHATADQMGNSPAVVKSHYRAVASKRDAEKWFSFTPASIHTETENVPFETRQATPSRKTN